MPDHRRRRRRRKPNYGPLIAMLSLVLILLGLAAVALHFNDPGDPELKFPVSTDPITAPAPEDSTTEPATEPIETTEPPVSLVSTATVSATGDMLMHLPCIKAAKTSGGYDFTPFFRHLQPYVEKADYAVANLETTLAGLDNGYNYSGYPAFNCPDQIVPDLKTLGFDMLLTANNHCYDTRSKGYHRTQDILAQNAMDYIGSVPDENQAQYLVKDINGIKIGMVCYTYEDNADPSVVAPNGISMSNADEVLINSFYSGDLEPFYARIEGQIREMKEAGAEAIVLYIHWGVEYQLEENKTQNTIAQKMCDLGVDVIVGGHPHVIQPMELLTSTQDESHKTLCLYSTGNAFSNQRRDLMRLDTGHTEDGIIFNFTFAKYSDGTVRVEEADVLPLWVNKYNSSGKDMYEVYPLDTQVEDWMAAMDMVSSTEKKARASYDRTMDIVGKGLEDIQQYLEGLPAVAEVS